MSQSASDLLGLRLDLPASLELRRIAAMLIGFCCDDQRGGC